MCTSTAGPAPVGGTVELQFPDLLPAVINSQIKASLLVPGSCVLSHLHPPSPAALMDVLACKTTYETLNNNNVVISHSLFHRASI